MHGKFPIAERLRRGERPNPPYWWPENDELLDGCDWPAMIGDATLFDVSVACDLYWHGRKDYYSLESDWGPLRPPYPAMWMEWALPDEIMVEGKMVTLAERAGNDGVDMTGMRYGALVCTLENDPDHPSTVRKGDVDYFPLGVMQIMDRGPSNPLWVCPMIDSICVDAATGLYIPDTRKSAGDSRTISAAKETHPKETAVLASPDNNVVWMALNLLNCRNVTAPAGGSAYTRSGREKRQRVPVTKYHTIQLPGMSRRSGGARRSRSDEAVMAQHRVRGHFKTYTAEAPLLGKHVGTYWWGWNIRGSRERGEVISDYKFKESV